MACGSYWNFIISAPHEQPSIYKNVIMWVGILWQFWDPLILYSRVMFYLFYLMSPKNVHIGNAKFSKGYRDRNNMVSIKTNNSSNKLITFALHPYIYRMWIISSFCYFVPLPKPFYHFLEKLSFWLMLHKTDVFQFIN